MNTSIPSSSSSSSSSIRTPPTIIGFSQSRFLWDTVRQKQYQIQSSIQQLISKLLSSSTTFSNDPITGTSLYYHNIGCILIYDCIEYIQSLCIVIGYEIQLIRYNELIILYNNCCIYTKTILFQRIKYMIFQQIPYTIQSILLPFVIQHYKIILLVLLYYIFVRIIHNLFHAGPIVIILSLLVVIYQYGLDDSTTTSTTNNRNSSNNVSAYSVFNKGFVKLMGSIDVDDITNQYISGGMVSSTSGSSNGGNDSNLSYRGGTIGTNRIRQQKQQHRINNTTNEQQEEGEEEQLSLVRPQNGIHHHQRRTTTTNSKRR